MTAWVLAELMPVGAYVNLRASLGSARESPKWP